MQAFSILGAIVRNGRMAIVEMNKSLNAGKKSLIQQLSGKRKVSMHKSGISSLGAWSAAKSEAASLVRSLLEETRLVRFMIEHGPRCTVLD